MHALIALTLLTTVCGSVINRNPFVETELKFNRNSLNIDAKRAVLSPWSLDKVKPTFRVSAHSQGTVVTKDYPYGSFPTVTAMVADMEQLGLVVDGHRTNAIVHGFSSNVDADWMAKSAANMLASDPTVTVVLVGWKDGADLIDYAQAVANTQTVAKYLAELQVHLSFFNGFMACTGHSLGAHICGQSGRLKLSQDGIPVDYIAGLDPAGPLFETENVDIRLSPASAKYVENLHTDTSALGFGTKLALGHADYYANGEIDAQPGCGIDLGCSHSRAHEIYADTIDPGQACIAESNCSSYNRKIPESCKPLSNQLNTLFHPASPNPTGLFYFKTNKKAPWCPFV